MPLQQTNYDLYAHVHCSKVPKHRWNDCLHVDTIGDYGINGGTKENKIATVDWDLPNENVFDAIISLKENSSGGVRKPLFCILETILLLFFRSKMNKLINYVDLCEHCDDFIVYLVVDVSHKRLSGVTDLVEPVNLREKNEKIS